MVAKAFRAKAVVVAKAFRTKAVVVAKAFGCQSSALSSKEARGPQLRLALS